MLTERTRAMSCDENIGGRSRPMSQSLVAFPATRKKPIFSNHDSSFSHSAMKSHGPDRSASSLRSSMVIAPKMLTHCETEALNPAALSDVAQELQNDSKIIAPQDNISTDRENLVIPKENEPVASNLSLSVMPDEEARRNKALMLAKRLKEMNREKLERNLKKKDSLSQISPKSRGSANSSDFDRSFGSVIEMGSRLPRWSRLETSHVHVSTVGDPDQSACEFYPDERPTEKLPTYGTPQKPSMGSRSRFGSESSSRMKNSFASFVEEVGTPSGIFHPRSTSFTKHADLTIQSPSNSSSILETLIISPTNSLLVQSVKPKVSESQTATPVKTTALKPSFKKENRIFDDKKIAQKKSSVANLKDSSSSFEGNPSQNYERSPRSSVKFRAFKPTQALNRPVLDPEVDEVKKEVVYTQSRAAVERTELPARIKPRIDAKLRVEKPEAVKPLINMPHSVVATIYTATTSTGLSSDRTTDLQLHEADRNGSNPQNDNRPSISSTPRSSVGEHSDRRRSSAYDLLTNPSLIEEAKALLQRAQAKRKLVEVVQCRPKPERDVELVPRVKMPPLPVSTQTVRSPRGILRDSSVERIRKARVKFALDPPETTKKDQGTENQSGQPQKPTYYQSKYQPLPLREISNLNSAPTLSKTTDYAVSTTKGSSYKSYASYGARNLKIEVEEDNSQSEKDYRSPTASYYSSENLYANLDQKPSQYRKVLTPTENREGLFTDISKYLAPRPQMRII